MINHLTDKNLGEFISNNEKAVIIFSAPWCQPCKALTPIIIELSADNEDVSFGKINIEENEGSVDLYNIRSVPTVLYFKNNNLITTTVGGLPKFKIQKSLDLINS